MDAQIAQAVATVVERNTPPKVVNYRDALVPAFFSDINALKFSSDDYARRQLRTMRGVRNSETTIEDEVMCCSGMMNAAIELLCRELQHTLYCAGANADDIVSITFTQG
jgi:hypothetical protein